MSDEEVIFSELTTERYKEIASAIDKTLNGLTLLDIVFVLSSNIVNTALASSKDDEDFRKLLVAMLTAIANTATGMADNFLAENTPFSKDKIH